MYTLKFLLNNCNIDSSCLFVSIHHIVLIQVYFSGFWYNQSFLLYSWHFGYFWRLLIVFKLFIIAYSFLVLV